MFALDDVGDISSNIVLSPTPQRAVLNPKAETLEHDYDEANPKANFVALGTGSSSRRLVAGTGSIDLVNVSDDDYCDSCPSDSSDSGNNISGSASWDDSPGKYEMQFHDAHGKQKMKYDKLSYNTVRRQVNKSYELDTVHRYSCALDILASYLKGQKIIYMESRNQTVSILNRLMLPAIFLSALVSVIQSPFQCHP